MKARMDELERQKAEITARMAEAPADVPDVHPNIANLYRLRVERFAEALDDPYGGRQAAAALRSLIGEIVLTPGDKRGEVHAELRGELMGILDFARAEQGGPPIPFTTAVEASPRTKSVVHPMRWRGSVSIAFWEHCGNGVGIECFLLGHADRQQPVKAQRGDDYAA